MAITRSSTVTGKRAWSHATIPETTVSGTLAPEVMATVAA